MSWISSQLCWILDFVPKKVQGVLDSQDVEPVLVGDGHLPALLGVGHCARERFAAALVSLVTDKKCHVFIEFFLAELRVPQMLGYVLTTEHSGWEERVVDWGDLGRSGEVAEEEVGAETGAVEDEDA